MTTHYQTLGVPFYADAATIRKAFQRIARDNHPDTQLGSRMIYDNATEAYNVLKNHDTRREYDRQVLALAKDCEHCGGTGSIVTMRGFSQRETPCTACTGKGKLL